MYCHETGWHGHHATIVGMSVGGHVIGLGWLVTVLCGYHAALLKGVKASMLLSYVTTMLHLIE